MWTILHRKAKAFMNICPVCQSPVRQNTLNLTICKTWNYTKNSFILLTMLLPHMVGLFTCTDRNVPCCNCFLQ